MAGYLPVQEDAVWTSHRYSIPPRTDFFNGLLAFTRLCGRMLEDEGTAGDRAMIDSSTRKPIRVSTDGTSGPYIMVPVDQLDQVRQLLQGNDIPHWVDHIAISVDERPAVAVINLAKKTDPHRVQVLLDGV
jgi:hypothetical protein